MRTPWGESDSSEPVGRGSGIVFYGTPSHGGYRVAPEVNRTMPAHLRLAGGWYEEDCDWCLVVLAFPEYFTDEQWGEAMETFRNWHPARWEQHTGRTLLPGMSYMRDQKGGAA